jgi:hypothetical protein
MIWGGYVLFAAVASAQAVAPRGDAPPEADTSWVDAGLRPVPFTAKDVRASTRFVVSPDLRDPFLVAQSDDKKKAKAPPKLSPDLRDPFATQRVQQGEKTTPKDLRDPFDGAQDLKCVPKTKDGVKIQRPKALRPAGCPAARANRRTRLAQR